MANKEALSSFQKIADNINYLNKEYRPHYMNVKSALMEMPSIPLFKTLNARQKSELHSLLKSAGVSQHYSNLDWLLRTIDEVRVDYHSGRTHYPPPAIEPEEKA